MGALYKFSLAAFGYRPAGKTSGPLVTPTHTKAKRSSSKEKNYGDTMIQYLKWLNPAPDSFKHIISKDYGPSKGIRKNGKLRMNMLVYPGPDNYVMIGEIIKKGKEYWGQVEGLDEDMIPARNITHDTHPHLIHRVYGSNKKGTAVRLKDEMFIPVLSSGRWIQMKWLEKVRN